MLIDAIKVNIDVLMKRKQIRNPTHLAELSGIPQPTLSRMLSGKHKSIELETIRKLAKFFEVRIDQLIGDEPLDKSLKYREVDEYRKQLNYFFDGMTIEHQEDLLAMANVYYSRDNPEDRKANPFSEKPNFQQQ